MIYMHHRFYSPLLGHFLTPDFRAPDIYDPTTFTEPYAYAAGNPFMYWDADGLSSRPTGDHQEFTFQLNGQTEKIYVDRIFYQAVLRGDRAWGALRYSGATSDPKEILKRAAIFERQLIAQHLTEPGTIKNSKIRISNNAGLNIQRDALIAVVTGVSAPFIATILNAGLTSSVFLQSAGALSGSLGIAYLSSKGAAEIGDYRNKTNYSSKVDEVMVKEILPATGEIIAGLLIAEGLPVAIQGLRGRPIRLEYDSLIYSKQGDFEKIMKSGRIWGQTEGSVYAVADPNMPRWRSMIDNKTNPGDFIFEGQAASLFRKHPVDGAWSLMKRSFGQYKAPMGDIVFDPNMTRVVGNRVFINHAYIAPHAGQSTSWAYTRRFGRWAFIDLGLIGGGTYIYLNADEIAEYIYESP